MDRIGPESIIPAIIRGKSSAFRAWKGIGTWMHELVIPNVKRIVVLRALVLGDLIFALPALAALHTTYPEAEIVYLGKNWIKEFLPGRIPGIQRVYTFNDSPVAYQDTGYLIHPDEYAPFFQLMEAENFDLGFQMQGGGLSSNPFLRRCRLKVSIGFREPGAEAPDRWLPYSYHKNEIVSLLDLVSLAGAVSDDLQPKMPVLESDDAAAEPYLRMTGKPFVIIHSGARDLRRCWQPEKFARVADFCISQLGLDVVLTGTGIDEDRANRVQASMRHAPINLAGKLSLPAMVSLTSRARLFVGNDTGPLHLALAVGTPAVGVMWSEYILKSTPPDRRDYRAVISWQRRCPKCGAFIDKNELVNADVSVCTHDVSFVEAVQSEAVIQAVRELIDDTREDR